MDNVNLGFKWLYFNYVKEPSQQVSLNYNCPFLFQALLKQGHVPGQLQSLQPHKVSFKFSATPLASSKTVRLVKKRNKFNFKNYIYKYTYYKVLAAVDRHYRL